MEEHRHLPDADRVSVLIAAILLAYALTQLTETQRYSLLVSLFGISLSLPFNLTAVATMLAAGLTATGMDWLLRTHPHFEKGNTFQHWLLPTLTALIIGVPLYNLTSGPGWWLTFILGGALLILVFLSEYIALDLSDVRYPAASAGLIALSFALFLILASALKFANTRLVLMALAVFLASGLVALRALHLRLAGSWELPWAAGIGLMCTQIAAALHYWPVLPIQFGLAILAPLYALTGVAINLGEEMSPRQAVLEAGVVLIIFWGAALLIKA